MRFLIVGDLLHKLNDGKIYTYGPYVKEINLWLSYVDEVEVITPVLVSESDKIDLAYSHDNVILTKVPSLNLTSIWNIVKTIFLLPYVMMKLFFAMSRADHIHLRCPNNMGLLGAIVQILFPKKVKTVKYAGNWDSNSVQPKSYKLQQAILSSTFLSKNISVLVYGEWPNQSENICSFFTASYKKDEIVDSLTRSLNDEVRLLFVGSLTPWKRAHLVLEALKDLRERGVNARVDLLGEGKERPSLEHYIEENSLQDYATLHGNVNADTVKDFYKRSNFLVLMSKSEGWPKVVAEAMFWGSVPISIDVSCVNYMIGYGERGSLAEPNSESIANEIEVYIKNPKVYEKTSHDAQQWSRQFTLESMQEAVGKFIHA